MLEPREIVHRLPRDVDNCIAAVQFSIREKKKFVDKINQKTEPSENERIFVGKELDFIKNVERLIAEFRRAFNSSLGKIPPADPDLELAVLGALMLESHHGEAKLSRPIDDVQSFLLPEHFYMDAHEKIYTVILELFKSGLHVDMIAVKNALRKKGWLEIVGGAHYLAEATSRVSSSASVDYRARVILEFAIKRKIIFECATVVHSAWDDTEDCFELLDKLENAVTEIKSWIKQ